MKTSRHICQQDVHLLVLTLRIELGFSLHFPYIIQFLERKHITAGRPHTNNRVTQSVIGGAVLHRNT